MRDCVATTSIAIPLRVSWLAEGRRGAHRDLQAPEDAASGCSEEELQMKWVTVGENQLEKRMIDLMWSVW